MAADEANCPAPTLGQNIIIIFFRGIYFYIAVLFSLCCITLAAPSIPLQVAFSSLYERTPPVAFSRCMK